MADKAMKEVFVQCQNSMQSHGKLLKMLHKIYEKKEFPEFWKDFQHLMKYSLIIYQREPAVERTIDFISKFVTYVTPSPAEEGSQDDSTLDEISQNKLLQYMFDFLLQSHNACEKAVRFRCCQMINKILGTLGEDAQIDDDLYDRIYESMLERLRDKQPVVRMHAVMALARLQDPRDENCPVIKAYLFLVSSDPNYEVRRVVLSNIAPSTKTLPAIIQRTRDVKDSVRKMAYTVLGEKVHIKALSIANRVRLLQDGLTDRSEMVKSACSSKLLQTWLRTFGGNVLDLLGSLDVENSTETCELALETLFKGASVSEMVERFDLLDDKILIPLEKLNSESSMYWQTLCKYIHSLGHESDEYLDKVLPNCVEFCHYINSYVETLKDLDDIDAQLEKEFVIQQLLTMTKYMELADQASRRAVEKLLHDMLIADHVGHSLVSHIVPRLCEIKDNSDSMVVTLAETVSEIREPITTVERGPTQEEKRQNDLKIASIRVKLNQLKEELEEAVKNESFEKAAEIKASISACETERNELLEVGEPHVEEVRTEKTDVSTILKCQAIVAEMLEVLPLKSLNPTLQMLVESLILPGIQNEDSRVRKLAVQALGLCCVLSKDLVLQYLPLFMQASQIDAEIVRTTSLRVIFDMLHMHGLEAIQRNKEGEENDLNTSGEGFDISRRSSVSERQEDDRTDTASKLMVFLCGFLDGESSELRTVAAEGLAKLLLSGRVVSSKILSHLILLWYNPTTEDDSHLRHCLGTFFPIFAFAGRSNQEVVEDAFLPTLKTLLNAPTSSPLAEVNVENVAELLVQLSNARLLMEYQSNPEAVKENPLHDDLAVKVCNEILSNPDSFNLKLWVKILKQIELSENNDVVFKELAVLADQLIEVVKEKKCQKTLEKFRDSVKEKVPDTPTEENQNQNAMEVEETEPAPEEAPQGDTSQQEDTTEADRTAERSALNDTALQLEGSLFLQEAKTLRRAQSKISTSSTPPRTTMGPPDKSLIQSPVAVLFSTKSSDRQALEKSRTKWQDQVLSELVEEGENGTAETDSGEKPNEMTEISNSPQKDESRDPSEAEKGKESPERLHTIEEEETRVKTPKRKKRLDSDPTSEKNKSPSKIPRLIRKGADKSTPSKNESPAKDSPRGKKGAGKSTLSSEESPRKGTPRSKKGAEKSTPSESESPAKGTPRGKKGAEKSTPSKSESPAKGTPKSKRATKTADLKGKQSTTDSPKTKEASAKGKALDKSPAASARSKKSAANTPVKETISSQAKRSSDRNTPEVSKKPDRGKSSTRSVSSPLARGSVSNKEAKLIKKNPVVRLTKLKSTSKTLATTRQSRSTASSQSPKRTHSSKSSSSEEMGAKKAKKADTGKGSQESLTGSEDLFDSESPEKSSRAPRSTRKDIATEKPAAKKVAGKSDKAGEENEKSKEKVSGNKKSSSSSQSEEEDVSIRRRVKSATKSGRKSADLSTTMSRSRLSTGIVASPGKPNTPQRSTRGNKTSDSDSGTPSQSKRQSRIPDSSSTTSKKKGSGSQNVETPVRQTRGTLATDKKGKVTTPRQKTATETPKSSQSQRQSQGSERSLSRGKRGASDSQSPRRGTSESDHGSPVKKVKKGDATKDSKTPASKKPQKKDEAEKENVGKSKDSPARSTRGKRTLGSPVMDASSNKKDRKTTDTSQGSKKGSGDKGQSITTPQRTRGKGDVASSQSTKTPVVSKTKASDSDNTESPIRKSRTRHNTDQEPGSSTSTRGQKDSVKKPTRSAARKAWGDQESDLDNSVFSSPSDRRASTRSVSKADNVKKTKTSSAGRLASTRGTKSTRSSSKK